MLSNMALHKVCLVSELGLGFHTFLCSKVEDSEQLALDI